MGAGGMGRRRGPTLAERSAPARAAADHDAASENARRAPPGRTEEGSADPGGDTSIDNGVDSGVDNGRPGPRRRHCWVAGPGDGSGPWPGLVVEWHRDDGGWRARVVYLVGEPDSATTVETWIDAAHLRPA